MAVQGFVLASWSAASPQLNSLIDVPGSLVSGQCLMIFPSRQNSPSSAVSLQAVMLVRQSSG
jgi:hypothetical protein